MLDGPAQVPHLILHRVNHFPHVARRRRYVTLDVEVDVGTQLGLHHLQLRHGSCDGGHVTGGGVGGVGYALGIVAVV